MFWFGFGWGMLAMAIFTAVLYRRLFLSIFRKREAETKFWADLAMNSYDQLQRERAERRQS